LTLAQAGARFRAHSDTWPPSKGGVVGVPYYESRKFTQNAEVA
jgi:hypothetical protein